MFRKFSLKTLSLTFAALLVVVIITHFADSAKGVNTLKNVLFNVDTKDITSVFVYPKMLNGEKIELKKEGDDWMVLSNGKSYNGDADVIKGLINQVNGLKPMRLATRSKDNRAKFELTDSLSSKVELVKNGEVLASLYIGKFSYLQAKQNPMITQQNPYYQGPRGTMTTYVRSDDHNEVYAIEGFLGSSINRNADAFRNKQLLKVNKNNLSKISFTYPADSSFTMVKNEDVWMCNGVKLDSTAVAGYLSKLTSLKGSSFTDKVPGRFSHSIQIQDVQMHTSEIKAFLEGDEVVLTSTQNPGSTFKENKDANFSKLFISKASLE